MASLSITNTFVTGTQAVASQVNQNFSDVSTYINARNGGTAAWDAMLVSSVINQLVLGTTNTTTISATAPASSAVYTIPDVGTVANFVLSAGTQTIGGAKTFSSAITGANGDVNAPGFGFSDGGLGMYRSNINELSFASNSTQRFKLTTSGALTGVNSSTINMQNTGYQVGSNQVYPLVQVVTANSTTVSTKTSSTFADTNLTVSITPKFSTSKILIMASGVLESRGSGTQALATLARGGTNLLGGAGGQQVSVNTLAPCFLQIYDSPATTSATTYSVQLRNTDNSTTVAFGATSTTQYITAMELAQ